MADPQVSLGGFDDLAGLDAGGTNLNALAAAIGLRLDLLQVWVPAATGGVVGVRDVVAELRAFAAKITFLCHSDSDQMSLPVSARERDGLPRLGSLLVKRA